MRRPLRQRQRVWWFARRAQGLRPDDGAGGQPSRRPTAPITVSAGGYAAPAGRYRAPAPLAVGDETPEAA
jgi:hypothetical protein